MTTRFRYLYLIGDVPPRLAGDLAPEGRPLCAPPQARLAGGRLRVRDVLQFAAAARTEPGAALVLTDADLYVPQLRSLFGYADRKSRVALVSIARYCDTDDLAHLAARTRSAILHEWGHLQGLGHCRSCSCVMAPVRSGPELDQRPDEPCPRCATRLTFGTRRREVLRVLGGASVLGLLALALDFPLGRITGPAPDFPFT